MRGRLVPLHRLSGALSEMSDQALIAACAAGDTPALGALFDRFSPAVCRFVARLAGVNDRDLDDLVQTTFLEAFRAAPAYAGRAEVRTWIFAIAANVTRHYVRSEVRRNRMLTAIGAVPPARGQCPDDLVMWRQLVTRMGEGLAALPHDLRVAFVMCEVEGIAGREAAQALGVREGTLWRRLREARQRLRAHLGGDLT